jgi:hypothetical protein
MRLIEEIGHHSAGKKKQRGNGRQAFLAQLNLIEQALAQGSKVKEVWEFLHEKGTMPVQYTAFTKYVKRYIKGGHEQVEPKAVVSPPKPSSHGQNEHTQLGENHTASQPKQLKPKLKSFQFDPLKNQNEEF